MKSMKEAGLVEIQKLKNRVGRALGKGSISREDHDEVRDLLDQLEDKIVNMEEEDDGSS